MKDKKASYLNRDTISAFCEGDVVTSSEHGVINNYFGVVDEINAKENKVYVSWSGGTLKQHDPNELVNHTFFSSGRSFTASFEEDIHGLKSPVSGGTNVMQELARKLSIEALEKAGISLSASEFKPFKSRRAVYHREKGRIYQRSKNEKANEIVNCSKCKAPMEEHGFSRSSDLYICPSCGWKITSDKII